MEKISGNIVDLIGFRIYPGTLVISGGRIKDIIPGKRKYREFILPGFVDAHIHIESSMLPPAEFARLAVAHGTVATVSDPHEIGNVLGVAGVEYMIREGKRVPFKFYFGAPSCVPATSFETSGSEIIPGDVDRLMKRAEIKYLSEVMNYPGVIARDKDFMAKIKSSLDKGKPVDGHAPGLRGGLLKKYASAGISTDHESFEYKEGLEKIKLGMKLIIREGSAAKNFEALIPLLDLYPDSCMFGSDDKHPDDLARGHINLLVERALKKGINVFKVLRAASLNPVKHYKLAVGLLQKNDPADFIITANLDDLNILATVIDGQQVAAKGKSLIPAKKAALVNKFAALQITLKDLAVRQKTGKMRVMAALDKQLVTGKLTVKPAAGLNGFVAADPLRDILKIAVVNRYKKALPSVGFIKNFGLKKGAIASSVAHDSHNVVAVGANDEDLLLSINSILGIKGGLSVVYKNKVTLLELPIGGLMSGRDGYEVARKYEELDRLAKKLGSRLTSPFMTLSFMALPVIPSLKITDKGLFDVDKFRPVDLFI
ncbi:MAG: adenine deaminase, adenine deaminase [Candidatus Gottesmanbacteria bacterium GW2011_GWA2_43_14]|uniref:Adenine deaminase n=1 Tax=Candidatus Gottesmanbacteria bacterium GW2011_GWA2_43_14 TaxID=1618443 RepID=A0A0G1DES7_9BACT|nr:MAG: adenine deaminase, adenine deaminase [Candidatus Gottesmanbacteria bacterium GW2011_GWA2_43_14]